MNAKSEVARALAAAVVDIESSAAQLREALMAERTALNAGDEQQLLAATALKTQLLQRLDALERERVHLLEQCVERGRSQPFAMSKALGGRPEALSAWEQALATLEDCRLQNQANGSAVEARLRHVRRALELLTGARADADLYGRSGTAETLRRSQTLARI